MAHAKDAQYFYMAGAERRGPFSFEQILQQPMHRQTPVWYRGMTDWQSAGQLPELASLIPPAPPVSPVGGSGASAGALAVGLADHATALAVVNRGILVFVVLAFALTTLTDDDYGLWYWIEALARSGLILYAALKVGLRLPWLWALGGLIPFIWLFVLLGLHGRLKKPLVAAGYRISFLGRATAPAGRPNG